MQQKMNRYIITKTMMKGQEYLVSALYDEKRNMIEVVPEWTDQTSILGNIYIGRVENVVKNLNAAFVKISSEQNCYLPLEDLKNPIFTKKSSVKKKIAAGDELLVQVSKEALKTKDPMVTTNLNFSGKYAVLTSGNHQTGVSSKLSEEQKRYYMGLLQEYSVLKNGIHTVQENQDKALRLGTDYGIIVRTNAAEASSEELLQEVSKLEEQYVDLYTTAKYKNCYSLLYQETSGCLKHVRDLRQEMLEAIVTDDRTIFEELCSFYQIPKENLRTGGQVVVPVNEITTPNGIRLQYYTDEIVSLSALYSVNSKLEDALKERVWLKSGAYLIIQPTEALTVIDVNTGKNIAKKNIQENFLKVNKEAAIEIARQIRLRNISGIIVVDFINMFSKEDEDELMSVFRVALKQDPVPTQLVDMTKLGLVEVTRKKVRKSLSEMCGGGEW